MNKVTLEYDENGRIFHIIGEPSPPGTLERILNETGRAIQIETDFSSYELHNAAYVSDGEVVMRPTFDCPSEIEIVADNIDSFTIHGLPNPCTVYVDGEPTVNTEGELVIQSNMAAEYDLVLEQWPYVTKKVKVIANAPE